MEAEDPGTPSLEFSSSQLLSQGPFEFIKLDPAMNEERIKLLQELQNQHQSQSAAAGSGGILATTENRQKYAQLCSLWIDHSAGIKRIPLAECIPGMYCFS